MPHAFSIDVEDWYQGIDRPLAEWSQYEKRIRVGMDEVLALLERYEVQVTCFVLGKVAEEHPGLIADLLHAGHEIATHGYHHQEVHKLTPGQFREDIRRSIDLLQDLTGEPVIGYRAPYFTVTSKSLWALDIMAEEGILYDSSIHPVFHYRYGIPGADRTPQVLTLKSDRRLLEVPVTTYPVMPKFNMPIGGGAYLRLYPQFFQNWFYKRLEARGETLRTYMHPWEMDTEQPRISLPWRLWFTHYVNLKSTKPKLEALLQHFDFAPFREVYRDEIKEVRSQNWVGKVDS